MNVESESTRHLHKKSRDFETMAGGRHHDGYCEETLKCERPDLFERSDKKAAPFWEAGKV
jgi:hypothetical protein